MDMITARRRILIGQPHQVTASGAFAHFVTDMAAPLIITGSGNITVCGVNLFDENYSGISSGMKYVPIFIGENSATLSTTLTRTNASQGCSLFLIPGSVSTGGSSSVNGVDANMFGARTFAAVNGYVTVGFRNYGGNDPRNAQTILNIGSAPAAYTQYSATTLPAGTARKALVGVNNIWSDSGNITVTYWTH